MELIIGIVAIIILLCFFNLCSNASKIRKLLEQNESSNKATNDYLVQINRNQFDIIKALKPTQNTEVTDFLNNIK